MNHVLRTVSVAFSFFCLEAFAAPKTVTLTAAESYMFHTLKTPEVAVESGLEKHFKTPDGSLEIACFHGTARSAPRYFCQVSLADTPEVNLFDENAAALFKVLDVKVKGAGKTFDNGRLKFECSSEKECRIEWDKPSPIPPSNRWPGHGHGHGNGHGHGHGGGGSCTYAGFCTQYDGSGYSYGYHTTCSGTHDTSGDCGPW